ncbi:hypothetical protein BH10PSE4_BH10PSE4_12290 [soil metagenome]
MSGPSRRLLLALRLREWSGWALIVVEAHWRATPAPLRSALRGVARLGPIRRWIRID